MSTHVETRHRGDIEPSLSCPDVGKVGYPLLVRPVGRELAIEHITGDDRALAMILGKPASSRPCSQTLLAHEPFDPVQATGHPIGQQIVPDTARIIRAITSYMAGTDLRTDHLVVAGTLRRRAD